MVMLNSVTLLVSNIHIKVLNLSYAFEVIPAIIKALVAN